MTDSRLIFLARSHTSRHQPVESKVAPPTTRLTTPPPAVVSAPVQSTTPSKATAPSTFTSQTKAASNTTGNYEVDAVIADLMVWRDKLLRDPHRSGPDAEFDEVSREVTQKAKSFIKCIDDQPFDVRRFSGEAITILSRVGDVVQVLFFYEDKHLQRVRLFLSYVCHFYVASPMSNLMSLRHVVITICDVSSYSVILSSNINLGG